MDVSFPDQVVLITGASTGIGAALAKAFGAAAARVVVHYHHSAEAAQTVANDIGTGGGAALVVQADLQDATQLEAVVTQTLDHFGRIDILINNAGSLVQRQTVADMNDDTFQAIMDLNMTAVFRMCRQVIPIMRRQGNGTIINVSSIAGRNGGAGGSVIYATSKGAVATFTRGLAKELAGDGIRVNALAPGVILTPFHERFTDAERMDAMVRTIPMGRAGTPEECVGAVFFLASERMSGYVTGQVIEVNGGQLMP